jgi:hypothetical protein
LRDNKAEANSGNRAGNMTVLVLGPRKPEFTALCSGLTEKGFICSLIAGDEEEILDQIETKPPDVLLIAGEKLREYGDKIHQEKMIPVIALLSNTNSRLALEIDLDDFILEPYKIDEYSNAAA